MSGVNRAIIVGHLGRDPDVRTDRNGKKIVNFSVATSRSWRDKQTGDRKEITQWHRVVVFNDVLTEEASRLKTGSHVFVQGTIETRKWTAPDGDKYFTEIVLRPFDSELQLLPKRGSGSDMGQSEHDYNDEGRFDEAGREQITDEPLGGTGRRPARNSDLDDDIPFNCEWR
jgi:single-strand DNA-binding protein